MVAAELMLKREVGDEVESELPMLSLLRSTRLLGTLGSKYNVLVDISDA